MEGMQEILGKRMVEIQVIVLSPEGKVRLKRQEKKKKRESVNKVMTHTTMLLVPLCSLNKKEFTSKVLTF